MGYIGDDSILESLGGQSTFTFSVQQNGDLITDASLTQSSLGTAAKQLKLECFVVVFFYLVYNTDVFIVEDEKGNDEQISR